MPWVLSFRVKNIALNLVGGCYVEFLLLAVSPTYFQIAKPLDSNVGCSFEDIYCEDYDVR